MKKFITGAASIFILDVYFNASAHFISNGAAQFICLLLFFPIASYIAKINGLDGLKGIGLRLDQKSLKYFTASFIMGFGAWAIMYAIYWRLGKFEIIGIKSGMDAVMTLVFVAVGFLLGSLINDLITRGLIINLLKGKLAPIYLAGISIFVYAADDFWNGGLTVMNFVFSMILGLSLTYSFLKTGSIWADTGIHFGLNTAFGLLYGLNGKEGGGILVINKGNIDFVLNNMIVLTFAALLFAVSYIYYRGKSIEKKRENNVAEAI
ncbi:CAAX protease self-immunity [Bacillus sp. OV322]|uniref:CPBP family intramembrane glutamic endopeptidase n=1 Tax=Bacillus sp. OV322 TaxID=1882764 RepID=UPI0008EB0B90|nr:CPBP family intramembrane glutamic endopeptidase [Bacillus sp. OV322]SFC54741.1 CAAX protease self-immunity [Bacillus sp. OV322]